MHVSHRIADIDCELIPIPVGDQPIRLWRPIRAEAYILNTAEEDFGGDERLPYWAMLWPASIAVANFIATRQNLQGKSLLELGAGLALPALAAARAGANVTATDWYTDALEYAQASAVENGLVIETQFLDWRYPPELPGFDFIVCADLLYERRNHLPILLACEALIASNGKVIFGDPERVMSPAFFELAGSRGWLCTRNRVSVDWEGGHFQVDCWEMVRPRLG
jgi:predicted nicotinamide N-methyase